MKINKPILKTSLITIAILLVVTTLFSTLFCFIAPVKAANFCEEMGFSRLSEKLYYRDYKNNKSISSLFNSLKVNIEIGNNKNIVSRFEELNNNDNYNQFVDKFNEEVLNSSNSHLIKASLFNLNNYLNEKYLYAQIKLGRKSFDDIFNLAINDFFTTTSNIDFNNQGVYLLSVLIKNSNKDELSIKLKSEVDGKIVFNELNEYFSELYKYLSSNINSDAKTALKIALANRSIKVGYDILDICEFSSEFTANSQEINSNINKIMEYINGLLNE